jgi:hypothetical protein
MLMSRAVIMITDSGMLMGEVIQSSRRPDGSPGGKVTSLLWAIHRGGAVLILPTGLDPASTPAQNTTARRTQGG